LNIRTHTHFSSTHAARGGEEELGDLQKFWIFGGDEQEIKGKPHFINLLWFKSLIISLSPY